MDITFTFIFAFGFILVGLATVYIVFGKHDTSALIIGTTVFLIGILIYLNEQFFLMDWQQLLLPAGLVIIGINLLMLFFDDPKNYKALFISLVFFFVPIVLLSNKGTLNLDGYIKSLWNVLEKYWLIILLAVVSLIFVLSQHKKENGKPAEPEPPAQKNPENTPDTGTVPENETDTPKTTE
ncbi:MAG: hypothetical protein IAE91_09725 [Ignavibacteriaceae bacterium]|nr:hypothetical protein [Ignavibacteriaceae bacterium]